MTQQITKVKFANEYRTIIEQTDDAPEPNHQMKSTSLFTSDEQRHGDFNETFKTIIPWICHYFSYPKKWEDALELRTVHFKRTEAQGTGVIFSLVKKYEGINGVSSINTPLIHEDLGETGSNKMPIQVHDCVMKILDEATLYLRGKRAQGELPLEEGEEQE